MSDTKSTYRVKVEWFIVSTVNVRAESLDEAEEAVSNKLMNTVSIPSTDLEVIGQASTTKPFIDDYYIRFSETEVLEKRGNKVVGVKAKRNIKAEILAAEEETVVPKVTRKRPTTKKVVPKATKTEEAPKASEAADSTEEPASTGTRKGRVR